MRIAVTGALGLLGPAVVKLAASTGHNVVAIDRRAGTPVVSDAVRYCVADITSYDAMASAVAGCDAVVHLAAHTSPRHLPAHIVHNDNVVASYNILEVCAAKGIRRVCQASSVNAISGVYSGCPRFDYFPLDEAHPTYNEDPYSLSKWICEAQAASIARTYPSIGIASLRFHQLVASRAEAASVYNEDEGARLDAAKDLWGYTTVDGAARACLSAVTANLEGHEIMYAVADKTASDDESEALRQRFFPEVPVRKQLSGHKAFFDSTRALKLLSWRDC
jgi:nucleoside-diphosphate-sugar epimerase